MEKFLSGKNIIFISPKFFNYEKEVAKALQFHGANVEYIDDRFDNGILVKALLRLGIAKNLLKSKIETYFIRKLDAAPFSKVDFVFALTPEAFSENVIAIYKERLPQAKFYLYMWDSFQNRKNTEKLIRYFDRKFSFDAIDCEKYHLNYLSLFYIDAYRAIANNQNYLYDFMFAGTAHSDRYFLVKKIKSQYPNLRYFEFYFFNSKILFLYNKLTNKYFNNIQLSDISYQSLSPEEVVSKISQSRVIIDIHHPLQHGLTIRLIEMIGAKRKIITTNPRAASYEFYHPNNILVIDREHPYIPEEFVSTPYYELPEHLYKNYHINNWITNIFK